MAPTRESPNPDEPGYVREVLRDGRVPFEQPVVRLRKALRGAAAVDPEKGGKDPPLERHREGRDGSRAQLVDGHPQEVAGKDMRPAARRKERPVRHAGGVAGDVDPRVPDPHHEDPPAREEVRGAVLVRVDLGSLESSRQARPPGIPVMPVGDEDRPVSSAPAVAEGDRPASFRRGPDRGHLGPEGDSAPEVEAVGVGVEVRRHLEVVGVVRIGIGHREVRVGRDALPGVDPQRGVGGRDAVVVQVAPGAADLGPSLEAVEGEPFVREGPGGGQSGGAGADHADPVVHLSEDTGGRGSGGRGVWR
jgi:hypothetical protein